MITQAPSDGKLEDLHRLTSELSEHIHDAARQGSAIHVVERDIWMRVRKLGQQALGQFIAAQGDGDLGETFTTPDGRVLKRLEQLHSRSYQSIFGAYELNRAAHGTR